MKIARVKVKVKVDGLEGFLYEHKHHPHMHHSSYIRAEHATEYIWTSKDNRNIFVSTNTGQVIFSQYCQSKTHNNFHATGVFTGELGYNHQDPQFSNTYSNSIHSDGDLTNWQHLYTPEKQMLLCLPIHKRKKGHPTDAVGLTFASRKNNSPPEPRLMAKFKVEIIEEIEVPKLQVEQPPNQLDFPEELRLRDLSKTPPEKSQPVFVSYDVLPSILVNEGHMLWQIQNNPFYVIKRYQYWLRKSDKTYAATGYNEYRYSISMKHTSVDYIERTSSIAIKRDHGFKIKLLPIKEFVADYSNTVSENLSRKEVIRHTQTEEKFAKYDIIRKVEIKKVPTRLAVWVLMDRFVIERVDGSELLSWDIDQGKDIFIEDSFPNNSIITTKSDYYDCNPDLEVVSFNENSDVVEFSAYSNETDHHRGNFDFECTIYDLESNEIYVIAEGGYWGPTAGENPYIFSETISLPSNSLLLDIQVTSISGYCLIENKD